MEAVYKANPKTSRSDHERRSGIGGVGGRMFPAILAAWYPAREGELPMANVLFGDYNPARASALIPSTIQLDQLPPQDERYDVTKGFPTIPLLSRVRRQFAFRTLGLPTSYYDIPLQQTRSRS